MPPGTRWGFSAAKMALLQRVHESDMICGGGGLQHTQEVGIGVDL